ncbi:microfibril-associated glycoprotein 4-like [Wyeomyia smithii]|uniref:microfibril-associated glycoprotein 4-like n=1 Tax=Wyeomyia smithii TaxID=174621 RepID=UPI002467BBEB|nr:microfibril-associated glycoprotein 4-like [Wyeomyia smithii]
MLLLGILLLSIQSSSTESLKNVTNSGFGYELALAGLEAINFSLLTDQLRSKQYHQTLESVVTNLQNTLANTEQMVIRQSKLLSNFEVQLKKLSATIEPVGNIPTILSELDLLAHNITQLLVRVASITRVQQVLPTTEMLNDFILQTLSERLRTPGMLKTLEPRELPTSCANAPDRSSGIRRIHPQPGFTDAFEVYCEQDYEDGGWIVIQNRFDGSVNFYRGWSEYESGFGSLRGEFWLGLRKIHELTYGKPHELHVILEDFEGQTVVAKYSHILVGGPNEKYSLNSLGTYGGTAGDSLSDAVKMKFSTLDSDNDSHATDNCAVLFQGAWWYGACHSSNLNGLYMRGKVDVFATMMCWKEFKGYHYGLKRSQMLIRATS